jgi:hypothetical protein
MTVKQFQESLEAIRNIRNDYALQFGRALCDFVICFNENDLYRLIFGLRMNNGVEGIFGMASAILFLFSITSIN